MSEFERLVEAAKKGAVDDVRAIASRWASRCPDPDSSYN